MDVEVYDVAPALRPQLTKRVENYRGELTRLNKEFVRDDFDGDKVLFVCQII